MPLVSDAVRAVDVHARVDRHRPPFLGEVSRRAVGAMEIDVFTLFPGGVRLVRRRSATSPTRWRAGIALAFVNYRDHTPLRAGQVDDTPFGGGAGMVLRVDVVEAALRARYGDRSGARCPQVRRVLALTPRGRVLDDASRRRARGRAGADAAVRPLRGVRRAHPRALRQRGGLDRPLRARRRRAGGDGRLRRGDPQAARRARPRGLGAWRSRSAAALEGAPEYPHYTRPAEHRGWGVPEVLLSGHHARIREWRLAQAARAAEITPALE